ncbi:MAG: RNA 2',3'-cyclic phosphodiesterase, partial [Gammaproteobacteria bacterium]|nr:RNA 2',3'-cyclic phosphodiesterase [Gammaproteobacteria bacterium]
RIMRPENLHITLHFIGNVSEEKLDCLDRVAQTVKVEPFELILGQYGHFYKAKIFWMGCLEVPQQLNKLYETLGGALSNCDYKIDQRPFVPHVTLMRKLIKPGELEDFKSINWKVNDFVLVESVSVERGVKYKVIKRYF